MQPQPIVFPLIANPWGLRVNCPTVRKVWGEEQIVINTDAYCGKRMLLNMGYRCSMHMHKVKDETFFIESGMMYVELEHPDGRREARTMNPGDSVHVPPGTWHRFTGFVNTVFFEFSTHDDPNDSYRREPSGPAPGNA